MLYFFFQKKIFFIYKQIELFNLVTTRYYNAERMSSSLSYYSTLIFLTKKVFQKQIFTTKCAFKVFFTFLLFLCSRGNVKCYDRAQYIYQKKKSSHLLSDCHNN